VFTGLTKVVRFIPDQPSRGGSKSAVQSHSRLDDVRSVEDVFVVMGRWRTPAQPVYNALYKDAGTITGISSVGSTTLCMNNFAVYSTTNAALGPTNHVMSHWHASNLAHYLVDHTSGTLLADGITSPDSFLPANFINIGNRCLVCWAGSTSITPPGAGRATNNIIYDPTNPTSTATLYDIGVNAPAVAMMYTLGGTASGTTTVTQGSNCVNNATVSGNWSSGTLSIALGGVPYTVSTYSTSFNSSTSCTGTGGTPTLVLNSFLLPTNGDYNGLSIAIAAPNAETLVIQSYVLGPSNTTVTFTTNMAHNHTAAAWAVSGEQLQLSTAYQAGTTVPPKTEDYVSYSGALAWTSIGPQYAYAYYDPYTGHVSNISPILQITQQNQPGVTVTLSNIQPSAVADQYRFTQIILFRTLSSQGGISGGILYPLGDTSGNFINLANSGGAKTYTDSIPDSQLLVNGGFQAPIVTNRPPVGPIAHMDFWDSRVWMNPVSDPTAIYFSADQVQVTFGRPEECFPSTNILRIPSKDGRVLGMRLVGSTLVITTQRYAYTVVGGPSEPTYRLSRFSSDTFGVTDYQMVELPGDTDETSAALVYLGGDSTIYILAPGLGNISLSDPVQDFLLTYLAGNQSLFSLVRFHAVNINGHRLLLVSIPPSAGGNFGLPQGILMAYDFNKKVWTYHFPGAGSPQYFSAFTNVYQQTVTTTSGSAVAPIDLVMASQGFLYSWLQSPYVSSATVPNEGFIYIGPFDGGRKCKKQLNFVRLYCNGATNQGSGTPSQHWTIELRTDENGGFTSYTPTLNPDFQYQLQPTTSVPIDDPNARELILALPNASTPAHTASDPQIGYRFEIGVFFPTAPFPVESGSGVAQNTPYDLYAIDVCYTELNEQGDVSL
jgi:hypothetical protein